LTRIELTFLSKGCASPDCRKASRDLTQRFGDFQVNLELLAAALRTKSMGVGHGFATARKSGAMAEETDMLSTLTILSMDQGKFVPTPCLIGRLDAPPPTATDDSLVHDRWTANVFHQLIALWLAVRHVRSPAGFGAFGAKGA
jgi:hypothetical protein